MSGKKHILFGVLNWGLGHATRSVPLIKALMEEGLAPVICSDGLAREYLKLEFPDLPFEELPPYNMAYGRKNLLLKTISRLPALSRSIRDENYAVETLLEKYSPVGIISDNRLGFYSNKVPSVYITHQLYMPLPFFLGSANGIHHRYIKNFTECWVPDFEGEKSLAGKLTHHKKADIPTRFIGPLSRFAYTRRKRVKKKYKAVAILSGPEPQRTLLEQKVLTGFEAMAGDFLMVRGRSDMPLFSSSVAVYDLVREREIHSIIDSAEIVISRSGYSSIMDYYYLQNKAVLIPTPGQPEQEYLADYHLKNGNFYSVKQSDLNLARDIEIALEKPGFPKSKSSARDLQKLFGLFKGK